MDETETSSGNPTAKVQAQLVKHDESSVMVYIGGAPIEVTRSRMPKTFEKLVDIIDNANRD